ncbi:hypothetical protein [Methanocalculus sp.]|nr:hypothetical protein [Methanocalculus sp.]MDG6250472.1 hypothetical protein [Methanocalculus sp.]
MERRFNDQHRELTRCIDTLKGQIELLKYRMLNLEDEFRHRWR